MIARVWAAQAAEPQLPAYLEHLSGSVLPKLGQLKGYAGMMVLTRPIGREVEIVIMTKWESWEAIAAFAGPDLEAAVVADQAAALLTHFDSRVRHYNLQEWADR